MIDINNNVIFNSVDNGIIILDKELNILAWNRWLEILTYKKETDVINRNICDLYENINEKKLKRKVKSVLVTNNPSFYNVDQNRYLIKIPVESITNSIYKYMQQNITIVPYDKDKELVCLFIYNTTNLRETNHKLELLNEELVEMTHRDPLTKLSNRRYFSMQSKKIQSYSKRNDTCLSLIVLDIDKFKNINDTYGHLVGDEVIIHIARALEKNLRDSDIISRFGGEEFVVLLQDCSIENAYLVAEKIREYIEKAEVIIDENTTIKYTVSLGVAKFDEQKDNDNLEQTFARADEALYEAKTSGRNKVVKAK